jgi:hypothetical protein
MTTHPKADLRRDLQADRDAMLSTLDADVAGN